MVVRNDLEALRTGVRFSPPPPKIFLTRYFWWGWQGFDVVREGKWTTRQANVVKLAKPLNANDDVYFEDFALAA